MPHTISKYSCGSCKTKLIQLSASSNLYFVQIGFTLGSALIPFSQLKSLANTLHFEEFVSTFYCCFWSFVWKKLKSRNTPFWNSEKICISEIFLKFSKNVYNLNFFGYLRTKKTPKFFWPLHKKKT